MQQRPETPVTPSPMPQLSPELPPYYPPKKSKLWLWITLAIVGMLVIAGIIITIIIVSNNSTSSADTTTSRQRATKPDKNNDNEEDKDNQQGSATKATKCLTSADFRRSGYTHVKDGYFVLEDGKFNFRSILFKPDSTQYQRGTSNVEMAKLGVLYKFNTDKQFSIELVPNETGEDSKLALERADKIKRDLVSNGIPERKITVSDPIVATPDTSDDTANRCVTIYFVAP
ncbi:hypothetical protein FBF32_02190 [Candidatus Saccharibacteria bacterium oral taxon 488]|jgi:hypothetical protein|nr:hypothetical protein FBF32_02190 [Candidatus Saccharibacteria bacterium oral taxon 488]